MGVRLPAEYQEVEYIQSTGTQWLDTGVKPRDNSKFKISFRARRVSNPGRQGNYIYGTSGNWCSLEYYNSSLNWNTGSTTHAVLITAPAINKDFDLDIDYSGNVMTISGFYDGSVRYSGTLGSGNLVFFAKSANTNMYPLRLYSLKIRQGDNYPLIRDFVPCYRKADDKPGMYDLVSGTFFINAGTGEFLVGGDVIDSISPWLVARRRMLMQDKRKWPVLIMESSATSSSAAAATVMQNAMTAAGIDRKNKMVFIKSAVASVNNQVVFKDWINNDNNSGGFFRKTNGSYVSNSWNSSGSNGSLSAGDRFIVIDPTIDALEYDKLVVVNSNITRTPEAKTFFAQNVPDDGYYLAYRKMNLSTMVHYDFIAGIFSTGTRMAYKAESNLQSGSIANWDNASYGINLYSGDIVYFLKINV